jgi:hypothetical protein
MFARVAVGICAKKRGDLVTIRRGGFVGTQGFMQWPATAGKRVATGPFVRKAVLRANEWLALYTRGPA